MLPLFPLLIFILIIAGLVMQRKTAKRVDRLEKEIKALQARITGMSLPPPAEAAISEPVTAVEAIAEVPSSAETQEAPAAPQLAARTTETEQVAVEDNVAADHAVTAPITDIKAAQSPEERESFESWLGARWAVWVGGVALAFGGLFLVKYTIEAGLLGPAARLSLAALFGIVLMAGGEIIRRRAMPDLSDRFGNAMIPGALTAAGAVTLMGAIFAAYAVYEFIGPTPAFLALALVSFATIALSLLHGQALAGLGLLASLATPALVSTENPSANALFGFLALVWLAVNAASRFRQWTVVPTLANVGLGLWTLAYIGTAVEGFDPTPATLALLVMIAGTAFFWPGRYSGMIGPEKPGISMLLGRPPLQITLSLSIMVILPALMMIVRQADEGIIVVYASTLIIAALAALGAGRTYAVWPALIAAGAAIISILGTALTWLDYSLPAAGETQSIAASIAFDGGIGIYLTLGAAFTALGFIFLKRFRASEPDFSTVWAFLMPAVPVAIATISFFNFGNLNRDWTHGLYGLGLGIVLLAGADWLFRKGDSEDRIDWPANLLVAGSFAGFTLALHTLTNGIVTTIALSVLGFLYVLAIRIRPWPSLPWMMAAAMLIVFGRIAWEPTVIGANSLGTTPFFNALLPGYGIPTLLAVISAWMLRNSDDLRIRNIMQALASLAALITVAVLVRHAMNGGTLEATVPTLGEQSIYTLITVGFSGILMMLDLKSPSPVFRFGSMIAGVAATANVLSLHLVGLNPYITGESTGPWPFFNLLLLGYLLPALAYALVAYLARERRPMPYVLMLAISGGVLGFAWATLSVRRFWQGENIADWKGFMAAETYTYSVVWLLLGILLLVLGSRFNQRSLRLASAALVLVAVLKVFLIDMSNLEGILRALSFMGLGAVLIGIGLFYQRILVKKDGKKRPVDSAGMPEGNAP